MSKSVHNEILPTKINFTSFCQQACIQKVYSTSREKRTSKHGISIVLELVSIEYQKRDVFLAGSCVARGKQTDISEQLPAAVKKA